MARKQLRDALTGEPLTDEQRQFLPTAGLFYIRVSEERIEHVPTPTQRANGERIETTPIPRSIDTMQPYPEGKLGGKRWHPEFARYLGSHVTKAQADEDRELREWWVTEYAHKRLLHGFVAKYGEQRGIAAYDAAMAVLTDPESASEIAKAHGHSAYWLEQRRKDAYHFAFAKESAA